VDAVVDTTVLIAFGHLDRMDLLPQLFERVWVPDAVYREALRDTQYPEVPLIFRAFDAGYVRRRVVDRAHADVQLSELGSGEAVAIAAARELGAVVVLDDSRARQMARSLGLSVIGCVGLLIQARQRALVPAALPLVRELAAHGFRIGAPELEAALAADDP
jgi:predicted nucleic acid-binding protein